MRSISELDLAAIIPLLASRILDLEVETEAVEKIVDQLNVEQLAEHNADKELLHTYRQTLDNLSEQYHAAVHEGINLPPYRDLVRMLYL